MRSLALLGLPALLMACGDRGLTVNYNNQDPEVSIAWPTPGSEVASSTAITLVALAADPETENDLLTLSWTSSLDGPLTGEEWVWVGEQVSLDLPRGISEGEHTLTIRVADEDGATSEASVDVTGVANQPPDVAFLTPDPSESVVIRTEDQYRMTLQVSDDRDTPSNLTVVWSGNLSDEVTLPPVFNADGTMGVTLPQLAEGSYSASISVRDSYGAEGFAQAGFTVVVDDDGDGIAADDDCDDQDPNTFPGAIDICDGVDNDCDGIADNNPPEWYADPDGDGFGAGAAVQACEAPEGHVATAGDCDNTDAAQYPGAIELCNGEDDDCDNAIDEDAADAVTWYADNDEDGYGDGATAVVACEGPTDTYVRDNRDCQDNEPTAYPGADELCDGIDNDCNGQIDEDPPTWYVDADGDDYGSDDGAVAACEAPSADHVSVGGDCEDAQPGINPGATEVCNGLDDDCNGIVDDSTTEGYDWYADEDGDGFGDPEAVTVACEQPDGLVERPFDCDDSDPARNPTADELCNGIDDNCDGIPEVARWVGADHPYATPQEAINDSLSGDRVCIDAGTYNITPASGLNFSGKHIAVQGVGRDEVILVAPYGVQFTASENQQTLLSDVTVQNTPAGTVNRGALRISGASPIVRRVRFTGYRPNSQGITSSIYIYNSGARLEDVEVDDIIAYQGANNGAAVTAGIHAQQWTGSAHGLSIHGMMNVRYPSTNIYQYSYGEGTALHLLQSDAFLEDVRIYNNVGTSPRREKGTVNIEGSVAVFERLEVYDNRIDDGEGAGLYITSNSDVTLNNAVIANNRANGLRARGGAIYILNSTLEVTNSDLVGNIVSGENTSNCGGGGIAKFGSGDVILDVVNTSIASNVATCAGVQQGGALYAENGAPNVSITYSNFWDNGANPFFGFSDLSTDTPEGVIFQDPRYRNTFATYAIDWDFGLLSTSPMRNGGDPSILNLDGTTSHIGSRGGPYATWPTE